VGILSQFKTDKSLTVMIIFKKIAVTHILYDLARRKAEWYRNKIGD